MARRNIFRKAALDRLSSPDQLDAMLSVTSPRSWLALLTALALLGAGVVWSCVGTITTRVEGQGLLTRTEMIEAVLYVPADDIDQIRVGMPAEIVPSNARRGEAGFVPGEVIAVADSPTTDAVLRDTFGDGPHSRELLDAESVVEVRVALQRDPNTASGLKWSSPQGAQMEIAERTWCTGAIVTQRRRPIDLVLTIVHDQARAS